jgi:hypothetical protein
MYKKSAFLYMSGRHDAFVEGWHRRLTLHAGCMGWMFLSCAAALSGLFSFRAAASDTPSADTYRLVHVQVLGADGKPAVHRDIYLRGWDRRALGPFLAWPPGSDFHGSQLTDASKHGWLYTTDDHGDASVRIGDFAGWKQEVELPGWGTYALLVAPGPDDAGGVSQRIWCGAAGDSMGNFYDGSDWGDPLPLPSEGMSISMALHPGFTLYGRVVDNHNHHTPLANVTVTTSDDLGVDTHTGYGGEIFSHSAITDSNGEFQIPHLYAAAKLHLDFSALWMTTNIGGKWRAQGEHVLNPPNGSSLRLDFGLNSQPDFHFTGTVTDARGQPVAGADVVVGISSTPKAENYGDTHHFERTTTDAQGHYDLAASSPWGTFLEAEDKTHGRVDLKWPGYDSPPIPPGKYDLTFPVIPKAP